MFFHLLQTQKFMCELFATCFHTILSSVTCAQIQLANSFASAAVHVFRDGYASSATKRTDEGKRNTLRFWVEFQGSQKCQRDSTFSKSAIPLSDRKFSSSLEASRFCRLLGLEIGGITENRPSVKANFPPTRAQTSRKNDSDRSCPMAPKESCKIFKLSHADLHVNPGEQLVYK